MIVQKFRNRFQRHLAPRIRRLGLPANSNDWKLWRLKNLHKGRRAFILGNGPSLRPEDLAKIHKAGDLSLSSNKIFLAFGKTAWRPTYYGIEDTGIAKAESGRILQEVNSPILVASYLRQFFRSEDRLHYFELLPRVAPPALPVFSENLLIGIYCGGTITYTLLQFAYWLGIKEVYLLGVDFSYNLPQLRPSAEFAGLKTYTPDNTSNYFAADYIKPDEVVVAPDLVSSLCAYESAKAHLHKAGRMKIFNATRGGKLEVFKRVDFDSLF